jgi:hypothetical protein
MKILAHILAMADAEVLGLISPRTIKDIKREDPTPMFKAFIIGQEGESRPNIVGFGATVQRWFRSAVEKLTEKLGLGLPVYHNHTPTNTDRNRPAIGEVVGKALKDIEGSLSSIVVAYIFPQYKGLPLDVASIEAGVMVPQDSREFDVKDVDIQEVTGIALGNSQIDKPAFPGATLLAQLQAFAETKRTTGGDEMTLDELRKAISDGKYKPSDLFDGRTLVEDPFIIGHMKEGKTDEYFARKRSESELADKIKKMEDENKALKDQVQTLSGNALKTKAKETFEAVLIERPKLKEDVRLSKFVRKQFDKSFAPTDEAKLKDDLNKFVDGQVTEFQELFGEPGKGGGKEKTDAERAAEAAAAAAEETRDKTNLLNPKNNDLIPTEI